jgi:leukotriene-A4 hydrolase
LVTACYELADKWKARSDGSAGDFEPKKSDIDGWVANQSVAFLERIQTFPEPLKTEDAELMGKVYGFGEGRNVEVISRYFIVGLHAGAKSMCQPTADLLGRVGRMKFVRPLYKALAKVDRDLATKTFEKNEDFYHPICRAIVKKDLFG